MFEKYFGVFGLDYFTPGAVCPTGFAMKSVLYKVELRQIAGREVGCRPRMSADSEPYIEAIRPGQYYLRTQE
jgi:hypothetical protein